MVRQPGAVRMTRGERAPHSGQADGRSHSAIARNCVNGPHFLHIYSYVGIDHLHPGKTHPAADQSVAIMEKIPVTLGCEQRWTKLCTSARFLNGLSSLQCTKQLWPECDLRPCPR